VESFNCSGVSSKSGQAVGGTEGVVGAAWLARVGLSVEDCALSVMGMLPTISNMIPRVANEYGNFFMWLSSL
jgi:hypothetical protein